MSVTFTTSAPGAAAEPGVPDDDVWDPRRESVARGTGRAESPWQKLKPLLAPPGVTAISGQVLRLDGAPLPGVTMEIDGH